MSDESKKPRMFFRRPTDGEDSKHELGLIITRDDVAIWISMFENDVFHKDTQRQRCCILTRGIFEKCVDIGSYEPVDLSSLDLVP